MSVTSLKGIGFTTEVQKTLGTAKTISSIAPDSNGQAVVVAVAHGFSNNDVVVLSVAGMVQLHNVAVRIKSVSTDGFILDMPGKDISAFTAFVSGTATKVLTWDTIGWATALNMAGGAAKELDTTVLADTQTQSEYGMSASGSGTIDGLDQVGDVAMLNMRAASDTQTTRAFRLTYASGQKRVFNANISAGGGFTLAVNDTGKMSAQVTVRGFINEYSS